MKPYLRKLIAVLGISFLLVMSSGVLYAAPNVQATATPTRTATPTSTPNATYVIDYASSRVCEFTQTGVGTSYCDVEWLNADYPWSTRRLIGFYYVTEILDRLENYQGGVWGGLAAPGGALAYPPYLANGTNWETVFRQRVTSAENARNDSWTYYTTDGITQFPSAVSCPGFINFFPSQICESVSVINSPYDGSNILRPDIRFKTYLTSSDPYATGNPNDEGTPFATVRFTFYPLVALFGTTLPTGTPTTTPTPGPTNSPTPTPGPPTATPGPVICPIVILPGTEVPVWWAEGCNVCFATNTPNPAYYTPTPPPSTPTPSSTPFPTPCQNLPCPMAPEDLPVEPSETPTPSTTATPQPVETPLPEYCGDLPDAPTPIVSGGGWVVGPETCYDYLYHPSWLPSSLPFIGGGGVNFEIPTLGVCVSEVTVNPPVVIAGITLPVEDFVGLALVLFFSWIFFML